MCAQTLSYLLYLIAYNELWGNVATDYWLAPMKVDWCLSWFNEEEEKTIGDFVIPVGLKKKEQWCVK